MNKPDNAPDFLPYSHWRIKEILKEDYHCELQPIGGYKCNRIPHYVQKYRLYDIDNQKVLLDRITLDAMRIHLTKQGYPLKFQKHSRPNEGAMNFLDFIEVQKKQIKHNKREV